jgi:L-ribulose-5-phosphate 4-epimerase
MLNKLKKDVWCANDGLVRHGLVVLTFGNASGIDRKRGLVAIKPSGVGYESMKPEDMVLLAMDGKIVEGTLRPSSDTPTHLVLYRAFPGVGGIVHAHSPAATVFAQAGRPIPCLGTTHADHFYGPVPVTRPLTPEEVAEAYEMNTGLVIVERFVHLDPLAIPAVLVAGHAPFVWGRDAAESVRNAIALEAIAVMAKSTLALRPELLPLESYVLDKHHQRKHGTDAYYGQ